MKQITGKTSDSDDEPEGQVDQSFRLWGGSGFYEVWL